MLRRFLLLMLVAATLTGCGIRDRFFGAGSGVAADALPYRAALTKGDDPRDFTVRIYRAAGVSIDIARESARFPATRYCIGRYGGSDVAWVFDAGGTDWAVTRDNADLIVAGRCIARA